MTKTLCQWILGSFCVTVPFLTPAPAQDRGEYCAFEVSVTTPAGEPVAGANVAEYKNGQLIASALTNQQGAAALCDAPSGLVDIVVGGNLCGAVSVKYLRPLWMETRRVYVTYQNCSGEEWFLPGGCLLTMRVRDERGDPLAGVDFVDSEVRAAPRPQTKTSDRYGRIFRFIKYDTTLRGTLKKEGYLPSDLTVPCKPGQSYDIERSILLRLAPRIPQHRNP